MAGILASVRITGTKVSEHTFLFYGAGEVSFSLLFWITFYSLRIGSPFRNFNSRILTDDKTVKTSN